MAKELAVKLLVVTVVTSVTFMLFAVNQNHRSWTI